MTLTNLLTALSVLGTIVGIIGFFRKPFKYRFIWLFTSIVGVVALFITLEKNIKTHTDGSLGTPDKSQADSSKRQAANSLHGNNDNITINNTSEVQKPVKDKIPSKNHNGVDDLVNNTGNKGIEKEEINNYINNTIPKSDIAVLVIDNNNRSINSISSEIATLYRSKGHSVTTSLFTNSFLNSPYLNEVQTGNSKVIDKLGLASQVSYIVIAKYSNDFNSGEQTKWISRANLDVSVISCLSKSQVDGFTIAVSNGFDDKQHAEIGAKEKIILSYKTSHLNL